MLSIFVCEDEPVIRAGISKCIRNYILMENLDMELAVSAETPYEVLDYLSKHKVDGLYFLDVDLNSDIDGIRLAEKIREYDPRGFIVFITAHGEALHLTFKYKVEALDFIVKDRDNLEERICECIRSAKSKYNAKPEGPAKNSKFVFKRSNGSLLSLHTSNILYFETSSLRSHRVIVYSGNAVYDFYGSLNDIERTIDESFYRCHKSFIINLKKVVEVNDDKSTLLLENGATCPISMRKLSKLKSLLLESKL